MHFPVFPAQICHLSRAQNIYLVYIRIICEAIACAIVQIQTRIYQRRVARMNGRII